MESDLLKELKDTGFPQHMDSNEKIISDEGVVINTNDYSYNPSLEELIEECGNEFYSLTKKTDDDFGDYWEAYKRNSVLCGEGVTPKIAVAKLWLLINKK